jgi:hypothetical protein
MSKAGNYSKGEEGMVPEDDKARWAIENEINKAIMPDAGKVPLDESESCGRGIVKEIRNSVFKWWWPVSTYCYKVPMLVRIVKKLLLFNLSRMLGASRMLAHLFLVIYHNQFVLNRR